MKTSGCCAAQHPDVLYKNMGMFYIKTSGCFQQEHGDVFIVKMYFYLQ